ncbi:TatD family hydrolase [Minwuia thermotolerans]|uniref:LuxR family transcriptional regulator n=1 Tax=Minwuia thermotolerans TaxID=2056226 RepID=A0A2M9G360_9PROT|nr:TatD family hydrolase [Minwuia thermotolerans]PJK30159.1 LuxR family transcriptional regulator [Minwuia thermotolerans]
MLVDSHCHLDYLARDGDLADVLTRARNAGVSPMLTISTKLREFDQVRAIAEAEPDVFCSVGAHPHEAGTEPDTTTAQLVELAAHPKAIGIGETGLDYFYEHSPRQVQRDVFRAHIGAARETGLPLIVHTRDAEDDTIAIVEEEMGKGAWPGLIHCFSGSQRLADRMLAAGLYISISGIVTFRKAEELRDVVRSVPLERLLVETDSPYLAPVPKRGKRNEPAFTAHTAAAVAELKGISPEALADATTANFRRLFAKAEF